MSDRWRKLGRLDRYEYRQVDGKVGRYLVEWLDRSIRSGIKQQEERGKEGEEGGCEGG